MDDVSAHVIQETLVVGNYKKSLFPALKITANGQAHVLQSCKNIHKLDKEMKNVYILNVIIKLKEYIF